MPNERSCASSPSRQARLRADDGRDVLISIDQHAVEDFSANGLLQTENPEMAPFAASLNRG